MRKIKKNWKGKKWKRKNENIKNGIHVLKLVNWLLVTNSYFSFSIFLQPDDENLFYIIYALCIQLNNM